MSSSNSEPKPYTMLHVSDQLAPHKDIDHVMFPGDLEMDYDSHIITSFRKDPKGRHLISYGYKLLAVNKTGIFGWKRDQIRSKLQDKDKNGNVMLTIQKAIRVDSIKIPKGIRPDCKLSSTLTVRKVPETSNVYGKLQEHDTINRFRGEPIWIKCPSSDDSEESDVSDHHCS